MTGSRLRALLHLILIACTVSYFIFRECVLGCECSDRACAWSGFLQIKCSIPEWQLPASTVDLMACDCHARLPDASDNITALTDKCCTEQSLTESSLLQHVTVTP